MQGFGSFSPLEYTQCWNTRHRPEILYFSQGFKDEVASPTDHEAIQTRTHKGAAMPAHLPDERTQSTHEPTQFRKVFLIIIPFCPIGFWSGFLKPPCLLQSLL